MFNYLSRFPSLKSSETFIYQDLSFIFRRCVIKNFSSFQAIIFLLSFTSKLLFFESSLLAQTNNNTIQTPQSPNNLPRVYPRDKPDYTLPENTTPQKTPDLLPSNSEPQKPQIDTNLSSIFINVSHIHIIGNTVFSSQELQQIEVFSNQETITHEVTSQEKMMIRAIKNQRLSYNQLIAIAQTVAEFYEEKGYVTSGAIAQIPPEIKTNPSAEVIVTIQVLEGKLEAINIREKDSSSEGKLANYIRNRLGVSPNQPLNVSQLLQSLQFLQIDPLVRSINAQLISGSQRNQNILNIEYVGSQTFKPKISMDNSRPSSIDTFQREVELRENNLLGLGDSISVSYKNTDGSNRIDGSYIVPVNSENGTVGFNYTWSDSDVIQDPFYDIDLDGNGPDIESNYNAFDLTFKQPIIRSIDEQTYREFNLSLTASWRETQSYLLNTKYPLSPGADESGNTRVFALRFAQEYSEQNATDVIAFRSEFNVGFDAFNSTINEQIPGVKDIPDSTFFSWRGQGQYVKLLAPDTLFLARSNIQLASEGLLPIEQFSIGGFGSVRGYRQDLLLTDNGWVTSVEFRYPILRAFEGDGVLQIIPFFDYGIGWNSSNIPNPNPQDLASLGLGLQFRYKRNLFAKIEYGIPLMSVDIDKNTWQENGIYFSIQYFPFAD